MFSCSPFAACFLVAHCVSILEELHSGKFLEAVPSFHGKLQTKAALADSSQ